MSTSTNILPTSSTPPISRFVVQSSDVIQDSRINVSEEGSETILWYKERFLSDEEIIEHLVHNPTSTICWTIHRPKRGWYVRIRAPSFPPGVFIPITPVPRASPHYVDAALSFSSRTNILPHVQPEHTSRPSIHSYPPTPPAVVVQPPSPSSVHAKLDELPKGQTLRKPPPSSQITQFILAPHSTQPVQPTSNSFFARALSILKNHRPSHSNSFTLGRVTVSAPLSPPPPYVAASSSAETPPVAPTTPTCPPVLVFHDRTPVLTVRSLTGLIEIEQREEQLLGVETSFWIAVALTYLEFLEERESYLAALSD
ncbi:hypothetical protein BDZ94DRAFT_1279871 [Collybia nuda]|uniref:Uncharacterized protein n=1 Tax=Collybia nuda TaxID=64659 RepID=A0A9P5YG83_9AGAR|nr:hypothetical protein BDZ94DRAFT_1279871 [Collybia nuda]